MHSLGFLKNELISIESFLGINPYGSLQRSVRTIEEVHLFHPIHLNVDDHSRTIEGFMWAPNEADLFYEIDLAPKVPKINFNLGSGDVEADVARVIAEIPHLRDTAVIRKAAMGKSGGGGKGKKGFYLEVGTAKEVALANFQAAVKAGIGTNDFVDFCVSRHFKMKYCKG